MFCPLVILRKWSPLLYYPLLIIVLLQSPKWGNYECVRKRGRLSVYTWVCVSTIYSNIFSHYLLSCSLSLRAFRKLSALNVIWRKPMLKFCGSHWLWCLRIDFVVSASMLTVLCQNAARCNPHQAIVKNDLLCLPAQPPQTWKCGKYRIIDLRRELKLIG